MVWAASDSCILSQAVTSIQEQTLSFVPKLFAVGLYPTEEGWRIGTTLALVSFMAGLSWGVWGGVVRTFAVALGTGFIVIALLLSCVSCAAPRSIGAAKLAPADRLGIQSEAEKQVSETSAASSASSSPESVLETLKQSGFSRFWSSQASSSTRAAILSITGMTRGTIQGS